MHCSQPEVHHHQLNYTKGLKQKCIFCQEDTILDAFGNSGATYIHCDTYVYSVGTQLSAIMLLRNNLVTTSRPRTWNFAVSHLLTHPCFPDRSSRILSVLATKLRHWNVHIRTSLRYQPHGCTARLVLAIAVRVRKVSLWIACIGTNLFRLRKF